MFGEQFRVMLAAVLTICAYSSSAWGWGREGHETTGELAAKLIANTRAEREVGKILRPGEDLAWASRWADCAKGFTYCQAKPTDEMKAFTAKNKDHHSYHYADVPFEYASYRPDAVGAGPEDVVHILNQAIAVLQGQTDSAHNPHNFTKREALFLVVHLTGDIHQPLHVGAAYLGNNGDFIKPKSQAEVDSGQAATTEGGNWLMLGSRNLHSLWDTAFVQKAMHRAHAVSPQEYAAVLIAKNMKAPDDSGAPSTWPHKWADESVKLAKAELEVVTIDDVYEVDQQGRAHSEWSISLSQYYVSRATSKAEQQLWLAGYRLAAILKAVWP